MPSVRSIVRISTSCAVLAAAGTVSMTAAEDEFRYQDIRIGYSTVTAPSIDERPSTGGSSSLVGDSYGNRWSVGYRRGVSQNQVGTFWGVELAHSSFNTGYVGAPVVYRTVMTDVSYGVQYGIVPTPSVHGHVELAPYVGLGTAWFSAGKASLPLAYEAGIQAGAYLDERGWTAGITFATVLARTKVTVDGDGGASSQFIASTVGIRAGLEASVRF